MDEGVNIWMEENRLMKGNIDGRMSRYNDEAMDRRVYRWINVQKKQVDRWMDESIDR